MINKFINNLKLIYKYEFINQKLFFIMFVLSLIFGSILLITISNSYHMYLDDYILIIILYFIFIILLYFIFSMKYDLKHLKRVFSYGLSVNTLFIVKFINTIIMTFITLYTLKFSTGDFLDSAFNLLLVFLLLPVLFVYFVFLIWYVSIKGIKSSNNINYLIYLFATIVSVGILILSGIFFIYFFFALVWGGLTLLEAIFDNTAIICFEILYLSIYSIFQSLFIIINRKGIDA